MLSQWECFLRNLGEWHGSFTKLSPQGEVITDTPTIVHLEGINGNRTVNLTLRRFPPQQPPQVTLFEFTSLNRSTLFFENGAFCQGSMQWSPLSQFGAEFGFICGDRRLRLVQLYNKESRLDSFTLIREKLPDSQTPERPPLTVEQLVGTWSGRAVTLYPDLRSPDTFATNLEIVLSDQHTLQQKLTFGDRTISSSARIDGSRLYFEQSEPTVQILLLPDGASANCPVEIKPGKPWVLETGWLITPSQRQRLIRSYGINGEWLSLTLVEEQKIS